MAGDSKISWDDIGTDIVHGIKVFCANNKVYGFHGEDCSGVVNAMDWIVAGEIKANKPNPPPGADWHILELSNFGISVYNIYLENDPLLETCMAVGSGRKVALYCMKYLKMSPREAVGQACLVDKYSGPPIYVASLRRNCVTKWNPKKKEKPV